jgi:hypothetical protein
MSKSACTMAAFPRLATTSTVDPIENGSPDTRKMSLSVFLASGLSIFAVVRGIFQNNTKFRWRTGHQFITSKKEPTPSLSRQPCRPSYPSRGTLASVGDGDGNGRLDGRFQWITQQSNGAGGDGIKVKVSHSILIFFFLSNTFPF